jgi:hypothetical protein
MDEACVPPLWARTVYYLPGHGGRLETGLGQGLCDRGWSVTGRQTLGDFRTLRFQEQVDIVERDLREHFWDEQAQVVGNSFGAYLFLHAQAQMPSYPGRVLLLSPIVGAFEDGERQMHFRPPRAEHLMRLVQEGSYPVPRHCEVHVGELDWQSVPDEVLAFATPLGIPVTVASGRGHMLGRDYVGPLLDRWLRQTVDRPDAYR